MTDSSTIQFICQKLNNQYPNPNPFLQFKTPYQFLVAIMLSAQCTDARVNVVIKELFFKHRKPQDILALKVQGLIPYIRSCGFFNTKAKNIIAMTKIIVEKYRGKVPRDFEELTALPGVGEKSAGVLMTQAYNLPAFPVDTHVFRVARRLQLSKANDPNKVSVDIKKIFPRKKWGKLAMQIGLHGRTLCMARKPKCYECPLLRVCQTGKINTL